MFLNEIIFRVPFWVDLGSILAPKWRPNGHQNGPKVVSKIDRKNDWIFGRFLEASGEGVQLLRGRGWSVSGPPLKLIAKAISDTIMSFISELVY